MNDRAKNEVNRFRGLDLPRHFVGIYVHFLAICQVFVETYGLTKLWERSFTETISLAL